MPSKKSARSTANLHSPTLNTILMVEAVLEDNEGSYLTIPDLKKKLLQDWPFLQEAEPVLEIFRIPSGEAFFWTMGDVLKEKEIERVGF